MRTRSGAVRISSISFPGHHSVLRTLDPPLFLFFCHRVRPALPCSCSPHFFSLPPLSLAEPEWDLAQKAKRITALLAMTKKGILTLPFLLCDAYPSQTLSFSFCRPNPSCLSWLSFFLKRGIFLSPAFQMLRGLEQD